MKKKVLILLFSLVFVLLAKLQCLAQYDSARAASKHLVVTADGSEFVGRIIKNDAHEVIVRTDEIGDVAIPKYQVKTIRQLDISDLSGKGKLIRIELFDTHYVYTNTANSVPKGDTYVIWRLWGPSVNFGITDHLTAGLITSWIGFPVLGDLKYSFEVFENVRAAIGGSVGTGSWIDPSFIIGLPYGVITVGDNKKNFSVLIGQSMYRYKDERYSSTILTLGGILKGTGKVSFIFDSYFFPNFYDDYTSGTLIPGLRFETKEDRAFQFGLGGSFDNQGNSASAALNVQWFRRF